MIGLCKTRIGHMYNLPFVYIQEHVGEIKLVYFLSFLVNSPLTDTHTHTTQPHKHTSTINMQL